MFQFSLILEISLETLSDDRKMKIWWEPPYYWAVSMALSHTCIYKAVFNKMTTHGMCFVGGGGGGGMYFVGGAIMCFYD